MKNDQLEIGFGSSRVHNYRTPRRRSRARWWFTQMRQAVEAVTGGKPAGSPPPAQIYMNLM